MSPSELPPEELPSSQSARRWVDGDRDALKDMAAHTVGRGVLLFLGARLAGLKEADAARAAVGGALAIEVFAVAYFKTTKSKRRKPKTG